MNIKKPKVDIKEIKKEINSTWFWYKVCEGCETPALYETVFCKSCRGYRFDENRKRIIDTIVSRFEKKIIPDTDSEQSAYNDLNSD